ncbi:hypothetical protein ACFL59_02790 [Planctomycetota bacterium]
MTQSQRENLPAVDRRVESAGAGGIPACPLRTDILVRETTGDGHCSWCGMRISTRELQSGDGVELGFRRLYSPKLEGEHLVQQVRVGPIHNSRENPCRSGYHAWLQQQGL